MKFVSVSDHEDEDASDADTGDEEHAARRSNLAHTTPTTAKDPAMPSTMRGLPRHREGHEKIIAQPIRLLSLAGDTLLLRS